MAVKIRLRGDTAENWSTENPVLDDRELAVETDTGRAKIGDGEAAWNDLPYWNTSGPFVPSVKRITESYTLTAADHGAIIEVEASGERVDITLPAGLMNGFQCMITKVAGGEDVELVADSLAGVSLVGRGAVLRNVYGVATVYHHDSVFRAFGDMLT